jgi:hypothetical protein
MSQTMRYVSTLLLIALTACDRRPLCPDYRSKEGNKYFLCVHACEGTFSERYKCYHKCTTVFAKDLNITGDDLDSLVMSQCNLCQATRTMFGQSQDPEDLDKCVRLALTKSGLTRVIKDHRLPR